MSASNFSTVEQPKQLFTKYIRSENTMHSALGSTKLSQIDRRGHTSDKRPRQNNKQFVFQDLYRSGSRPAPKYG